MRRVDARAGGATNPDTGRLEGWALQGEKASVHSVTSAHHARHSGGVRPARTETSGRHPHRHRQGQYLLLSWTGLATVPDPEARAIKPLGEDQSNARESESSRTEQGQRRGSGPPIRAVACPPEPWLSLSKAELRERPSNRRRGPQGFGVAAQLHCYILH